MYIAVIYFMGVLNQRQNFYNLFYEIPERNNVISILNVYNR